MNILIAKQGHCITHGTKPCDAEIHFV